MATLRDRVLDREPTVGCWVSLASPAVAELLAAQPVDSVVRDVEHIEATVETSEAYSEASMAQRPRPRPWSASP